MTTVLRIVLAASLLGYAYSQLNVCGVLGGAKEVTLNSSVPWHAVIYKRSKDVKDGWDVICGGSLLSNTAVLTAAHCVSNTQPEELRVAVGKHHQSWTRDGPHTVKHSVSSIRIPDEYVGGTDFTYDIAVLHLSEKVQFNTFVMPVCRDSSRNSEITPNTVGYIPIWGNNTADRDVQLVTTRDINASGCRKAVPRKDVVDKFCAFQNSGLEFRRSSGAGLTAKFSGSHYILGIASLKFKDTLFFTNVSYFVSHESWLNKVL